MPSLAQSQGGVNLGALDSMVTSYMAFEGLLEEGGQPDSSWVMKRRCEIVRQKIGEGAVVEARNLIQEICDEVLTDTRLEFHLKRQVFIELLRAGGSSGDQAALDWVRKQLAPLALDAYADAYNEFKKTLLMFLYDQDQSESPVAEQWSLKARQHLGSVIFGTLRKATGFKDPDLLNLLKYLLVIHKQNCIHSSLDLPTPDSDIIPKLVVEERWPGPLPEERSADFQERDIQAIVQAVNIPRQEAMDALKHTNGDVAAAFENELGRIQINLKELNQLVMEYAGYRGLLQISDQDSDSNDMEIDSNLDSREHADEAVPGENESQKTAGGGEAATIPAKLEQDSNNARASRSYQCDPKLRRILRLVRWVKDGKYIQAMESISEIDAELFKRQPQILFELWRFEVLRMATGGAHDAALILVRKKLTPIVSANMETQHKDRLVKSLQETVSQIMSTKPEMPSPTDLCSAIQTALQDSFGLPGPSLASLVRTLLVAHREWFKKQHCQDIFAKNLGIDVLHQVDDSEGVSPVHKQVIELLAGIEEAEAVARAGMGAAAGADPMELSEPSGDDSELLVNDEHVLQIMDILALPRGAAIDLLIQHNGNLLSAVENVVQ
ncbi:hypothetical protein BSKO_13752 [Bryopsis sp. KO-2023]|nr:hypothetical protein BSKO_13752 [Bryopsis sp. KO-2023]